MSQCGAYNYRPNVFRRGLLLYAAVITAVLVFSVLNLLKFYSIIMNYFCLYVRSIQMKIS